MSRVRTGRRSSSPARRLVTRDSLSSQPVRKPRSPFGASSSTRTSSTRAPAGPRRHQATNASTRSGLPSNTASTVPSTLLRTQPETSSERARPAVAYRKPTPWTRPSIVTWARLSTAEALAADERDEAARHRAHASRTILPANDELEQLVVAVADRQYETPVRLELRVERRRDGGRRRGDGDRAERRVLRVSERAVADVHDDAVGAAGCLEALSGTLCELRDALDRVHLGCELGEHRRLIARAGADVEHPLAIGEVEQLADQRDHRGLRDRLPHADRKRGVVVRPPTQLGRHEELSRDAAHRLEHALVVDVARRELMLDHPMSRVDHGTAEITFASSASLMSIVLAGGSMPIPSMGTSESPAVSEPWLPPPAWCMPARSASSQPGAAVTRTSPAFGLRSAASTRSRPSGYESRIAGSSSPWLSATTAPSSTKNAASTASTPSRLAAATRGSSV